MLSRLRVLLWAVLVGAVVGCVPAAPEEALEGAPPGETPERVPVEETALPEGIEPVATQLATDPAPTPATDAGSELEAVLPAGEVPQAMFDAVVADALTRSGAARSAVVVEKSEQVQWSDGSLGCPQPDMMYTMAIVDGYQIVLNVGGERLDYRLNDSGYFVLCENARPGAPVEGTPSQ